MLIAIVAFLLLFATFAVGLRCFSDFDRGLLPSKVNGQSYEPVTKMGILNGITFSVLAVPARPKYSKNNFESTGNMTQHQSSYLGGAPIGPRISIE